MASELDIALILAKKGSLGAPDKNIYEWRGRTLLEWTIEDVRQSQQFGDVFVTTNCPGIASIASDAGATPIMRDDSFADNTRYVDTVNHAIETIDRDFRTVTIPMVVQPVREVDVYRKILSLHADNIDSVVTVKPFEASLDWIFQQDTAGLLQRHHAISYGGDIARRNDMVMIDNAVVSFTCDSWKRSDGLTPWPYLGRRIKGIVQNTGNANYCVDVNVPDDLEWLEFVSAYPEWKRKRAAND